MKSSKQKRAEELECQAQSLPVDKSQLAPDGSYSVPLFVARGYYVDVPFPCQDCGVPQVWTAAQQKWWYEVAKGSVWTIASRCRPCRRRLREERAERARRGDPNWFKHAGVLLARVRAALEPALLAAGFTRGERNPPEEQLSLFINYTRPGELLSFQWNDRHVRLSVESITDSGNTLREVAAVTFAGVRSTADIDARLGPFLAAAQESLKALASSHPS